MDQTKGLACSRPTTKPTQKQGLNEKKITRQATNPEEATATFLRGWEAD